MRHAARQLPSWLIFDVRRKASSCASIPSAPPRDGFALGLSIAAPVDPKKGVIWQATLQMKLPIKSPSRRHRTTAAIKSCKALAHFSKKWETFSALCASKRIALDAGLRSLHPARESQLLIPDRTSKMAAPRSHKDDEPVPPLPRLESLFTSALSSPQSPPNKAPEPTSTSVTLRAFVGSSEMKLWTDVRFAARSAPAVAVAHL